MAVAKAILTFDFSILYTKLAHFYLVSVLNNIDFAFKESNENTLIFLEMRVLGAINVKTCFFTKNYLQRSLITVSDDKMRLFFYCVHARLSYQHFIIYFLWNCDVIIFCCMLFFWKMTLPLTAFVTCIHYFRRGV